MAFDINALLQGRNPYGRAGGNIANLLAHMQANNARFIDPRVSAMGFTPRDTSMDENPTPISFQQISNQNDWNTGGERTINGQRYLQLGDFFQNGRNVNEDDIRRLVKDPSLIQYDEMGGLITPDSNFIGLTPDDFMTNLVRGGIAAAGLGGTAAGIGSSFFGTPDLTSLLGGGTSSSGGLLGAGPPPLEGAPSLLGGGQSAASAAAQQALPGMTQAGVTAGGGGAMVPGMSYGMGAGGGLLGGGGGGAGEAATGAFDAGGWQGTGINGATGTRDFGSAIANNFNRYTMQAGNNIGSFFNDPLGAMARNPLNTIRAINGIYSVGSSLLGPRGGSGGASGGDSGKGGGGQPMGVAQGQFTPNQFTMAQLANLYGR